MRSGFGYIILWLMGVPISTLILIWIVSGLVGH
jgi:hypothetical protein